MLCLNVAFQTFRGEASILLINRLGALVLV